MARLGEFNSEERANERSVEINDNACFMRTRARTRARRCVDARTSAPAVCYKLTAKLNEFEMIDKLYH